MQPVNVRRWQERNAPPDPLVLQTLVDELQVDHLTAHLLAQRGGS